MFQTSEVLVVTPVAPVAGLARAAAFGGVGWKGPNPTPSFHIV
jgi:hypothetical protein